MTTIMSDNQVLTVCVAMIIYVFMFLVAWDVEVRKHRR